MSIIHLQPARYITFNIGSVDAFERNLDQAQREIGIDSTHFIPVTYPADPNWLQKAFVSMLPTLIILGTLIYFSRRISGGASGKGVRLSQMLFYVNSMLSLQGIFGVGQSTAKFINKETNIQTKFA